MKKVFTISIFFLLLIVWVSFPHQQANATSSKLWQFQSIDTMKYSRDLSREKLHDPVFDLTITRQMADIARTGATHVAIATPYDEEFVPILTRWVKAAREQHLHIWFRGNVSGW